jgi:hypothetical protein
LSNAVIYLQIQDANSAGSPGSSQLVTARSDATGGWFYSNLYDIRTADAGAYFTFSDATDNLRLVAQGGSLGTSSQIASVPASYPSQQSQLILTATPTVTATPSSTSTSTPTNTPTSTNAATATPSRTATPTLTRTATVTPSRTPTPTPTLTGPTNTPTPTRTPTATATPTQSATPGGEVVNPANIGILAAGTNVLLNFDNFASPVDGRPIPANYAGCTWTKLVEGEPFAGDPTWNIYDNSGTQGTITFPRPVLVRSMRVSSVGSTTFTLISPGNPNVSLTTSGNNPQTLTTGWSTAVTSLTLRASSGDQLFDDLRLTTN